MKRLDTDIKLTDEKGNKLYRFKRGNIKAPSLRRINKVKGKDINKDFSPVEWFFTVTWMPSAIGETIKYLAVVGWKFFLLEYLQKIHIFRLPVKHVDHLLDESVPFDTNYYPVYMDFINFWLRPLVMYGHRFGVYQGAKLTGEWFRYLDIIYDGAYELYRYSLTTTFRPLTKDKRVNKLRAADPHYCCIPSLHISIILLCWAYHRMVFERENFSAEEKNLWEKQLYEQAVKIGESVLYMKQHSVNCIPAAIYLVTKAVPDLFTRDDAVKYINDLFVEREDVNEEDKGKIRAHIQDVYEAFVLEGLHEEDWTIPVKRWLDSYEPHTPYYAAFSEESKKAERKAKSRKSK